MLIPDLPPPSPGLIVYRHDEHSLSLYVGDDYHLDVYTWERNPAPRFCFNVFCTGESFARYSGHRCYESPLIALVDALAYVSDHLRTPDALWRQKHFA